MWRGTWDGWGLLIVVAGDDCGGEKGGGGECCHPMPWGDGAPVGVSPGGAVTDGVKAWQYLPVDGDLTVVVCGDGGAGR